MKKEIIINIRENKKMWKKWNIILKALYISHIYGLIYKPYITLYGSAINNIYITIVI